MLKRICLAVACVLVVAGPAWSLDLTAGLKAGSVELQSAGPLAFGPDGVLFVGDTKAASVVAIATGDTSGNPAAAEFNLKGLDQKVAAALGTTARDVRLNDLAVNPLSGNVYLSASRGLGPKAAAVLLRLTGDGKLSEVDLKNAKSASAALPNAHGPKAKGRRNRSLRALSITDLAYTDGRVLVAGLSNEKFASTLRSIPFPFQSVDNGTAVEIYHGAHGAFETRSPVQTFATYEIGNKPHLLAAYTCTPLVKFSLNDLRPGKKVRGTTIAELGNGNKPLDMFVYEKGGQDFVLLANTRRGVMKITTSGADRSEGITERIRDTAGQTYDTIDELKGVVQLDRLNEENAVVLVEQADGSVDLETVALP